MNGEVYSGPVDPPEDGEDYRMDPGELEPRGPDRDEWSPEALLSLAADAWGAEHYNPDGTLAEGVARCLSCGGPAEKETRWILGESTTHIHCPICHHTDTY